MARTFGNTATKQAPKAPSARKGNTGQEAAMQEQADTLGGLPETGSCPVQARWGDAEDLTVEPDDFVIVVKGARKSAGYKSSSGKDTRILTTTPGMFSWLPNMGHPTLRRLGFKLTLMLSKPIKLRADGSEDAGDEGRDEKMAALL